MRSRYQSQALFPIQLWFHETLQPIVFHVAGTASASVLQVSLSGERQISRAVQLGLTSRHIQHRP